MIDSLIKAIWDKLDLKPKDFFSLLIFSALLYFTINTNLTVNEQDQRYYDDVVINASAVMTTLENSDIYEPNEILEFLSEKPAGKSDLKKGVTNDYTYAILVSTYGELAKNARIAFN